MTMEQLDRLWMILKIINLVWSFISIRDIIRNFYECRFKYHRPLNWDDIHVMSFIWLCFILMSILILYTITGFHYE